jgi:RND family efflux transporter MFP subunit
MSKWIAIIALLGGLAFGGYSFWQRQNQQQVVSSPGRATTAVIETRTISFVVDAAGDIGPDEMVSVRPEVNGRIAELPVDIGDEVKKGDLLCALDDRDLQTELASRLTEIDGARLQLEQAQRNYERSRRLYAESLVSLEAFQDTETTYELARNTLERAEKALKLVEDKLAKTRIIAPFDCTVLTRPVSIGQAVSGSGGFNSGTEIMTIANLSEMIITAHLNQADVIRLKTQQQVDVQVQAVPGLKLKGTVERIAPQATIRNNIKGFTVQIRLKDIDPRVRPGMTANMTIPVARAENVPAIPIAAIFTENGERFAFVKKGERQYEMRPIETGLADYNHAEVVKGLSTGEVVSLVRPPAAEIVTLTSDNRSNMTAPDRFAAAARDGFTR